jgi:hypothetical protein
VLHPRQVTSCGKVTVTVSVVLRRRWVTKTVRERGRLTKMRCSIVATAEVTHAGWRPACDREPPQPTTSKTKSPERNSLIEVTCTRPKVTMPFAAHGTSLSRASVLVNVPRATHAGALQVFAPVLGDHLDDSDDVVYELRAAGVPNPRNAIIEDLATCPPGRRALYEVDPEPELTPAEEAPPTASSTRSSPPRHPDIL